MPLNLSNRDQYSGHLFYNRRLRAAITRYSVRMKHDDRKHQAALALSGVLVVFGVAWMTLLHVVKPAGLVGEALIVGDRNTGTVYAKVGGRLHPALNLTSARLVVASPAIPTWVEAAEIAKYPTGPTIGIPGAPDGMPVSRNPVSAWSICDSAALSGNIVGVTAPSVVTTIVGELDTRRARPLPDAAAILATHGEATYLIWQGHRARFDPNDRALARALGLDPVANHPVPISTALFDAIPASEPLLVPHISDARAPSRWLADAAVGSVVESRDVTGAIDAFYVLLPDGIQKISRFVAELFRSSEPQGFEEPLLVSPDRLIRIPLVERLSVGQYPTGKMTFVAPASAPVTCLQWEKRASETQAHVTVLSGRGLPVPAEMDAHVVKLVRDDRTPESIEAIQTLVLPGASNLIVTTSAEETAVSREAIYWISPQGIRYGIESDVNTLRALGVDPQSAVQAPWPLVRTFAAGPAISREAALVARDIVAVPGNVSAVPVADPQQAAADSQRK